jgi:hypothetical protein
MQQLNNIPTKRIQVYNILGLSRLEGSELSKTLGLESRQPLTQSDIDALARLVNSYRQWREKGHSINTFCKYYANITGVKPCKLTN